MAAAEGESLLEKRRSTTRTATGESPRTTLLETSDMEANCGPEDVIRWWSSPSDEEEEDSDTRSCWSRITQSAADSSEFDSEVITEGHDGGDGYGSSSEGMPCSTVNEMQRRNISDKVTRRRPHQPDDDGPSTKSRGGWRTPRLSFYNCLIRSRRRRQQHSFLVTAAALLCTHLMLWSSLATVAFASRQEVSSNCTFPQRWEGTWFQSGLQQPIVIKGSKLSFRGTCIASDGDKFLMADDKCRRCVVIYEKHKNVLQYKESECDDMYMDQSNPVSNPLPIQQMRTKSSELNNNNNHNSNSRGGAHPNTNGGHSRSSSDQYQFRSNDDIDNCFCRGRESLQNLCEQIPGDALLYSMFKENAEPVRCPLKGPFTFTYNRGHGECDKPVSNIESCTEDSRLLLSFQACPDVAGTESTVEELTCLATWKDGNSRYLVGLVSHHHATSNEERYRCFVYEKMTGSGSSKEAEYKLAQSGDATCNGLDSAEVGSRIMTLRKAPSADRCDFPQWFKGRKHWHSIMGNNGYSFHQSDGSMHITKSSGVLETRALCEQINKQTSNEMMSVVHYTTGCQSGFMCMMFYRRDTHVAEIQMGSPAMRLEDACAPDHFDINKLQFVTLLASNPESEVCPLDGLYGLRGAIGPPYIPSRHKRNHNQRLVLPHNNSHSTMFNHDVATAADTTATSSSSTTHQRRSHRSPLSFRSGSSQEWTRDSWKQPTRGLAARNRRDTEGQQDGAKDSQRNDSRFRRNTANCVVNYNSRRQLLVGCTETNVIEVRPYCTEDNDEVYTCHGSWTHNGTVFIVARHVGSQHGVCMSYRTGVEAGSAQLIIGDVCLRNLQPPAEHHLVANLTVHDHTGMDREAKCSDRNASNSVSSVSLTTLIALLLSLMLLQR